MGFSLSNPIKSYSSSIGRIIKKPGDTSAWKDLGIASATGGWASSDAVEKQKIAEQEAKERRNSNNALTRGQQEGLDKAKQTYGVTREELAPKVREMGDRLEARVNQAGSDSVSAAIMNQASSARAGAAREAARQGMKGGAALGAIESIGRAKDAEVRTSLYGMQKQANDDYRDYLGNIISGTKALEYDTAALRSPTPMPPQQKSMWDDILGGIV